MPLVIGHSGKVAAWAPDMPLNVTAMIGRPQPVEGALSFRDSRPEESPYSFKNFVWAPADIARPRPFGRGYTLRGFKPEESQHSFRNFTEENILTSPGHRQRKARSITGFPDQKKANTPSRATQEAQLMSRSHHQLAPQLKAPPVSGNPDLRKANIALAETWETSKTMIALHKPEFHYEDFVNLKSPKALNLIPFTPGCVFTILRTCGISTQVQVPSSLDGKGEKGWIPTACFSMLKGDDTCDCARIGKGDDCKCLQEGRKEAAIFEKWLLEANDLLEIYQLARDTFPDPNL
ncbi:uncharacterized protein RCO7_08611 [Rhynchosporium graminicola]|uniref:Uncharacterized protein n=1 Tax=Rhynchosporium graminicola TaxID=2792576 RepID=A0A1E1JWL8_9HELO|nr:uncharacterized protein RCO7_08611 [Rhynchosporium commune]